MAKYLLLAFNGPTKGEGDEETYNRWYDEVHLPGFRNIDAVRKVSRYKVLNGKMPGMENWPYIAAYEIETDDLPAAMARMSAELQNFDPTLDRSQSANLFALQIAGD
jgi:hypothetical protein